MPGKLFDDEFLRKLRHLEVIFRRSLIGRGEGTRIGDQRGGRIEFRDFREYAPGDDFRNIDWNVLGRTDRLFVKEFAREEQLQLCVLVDASASMDYGAPSKFDYARRFALAMAYLGLIARNEVRVSGFAEHMAAPTRWVADPRHLPQVMEYLERLEASGPTAIEQSLRDFYEINPRRCLVIVVSDLLDTTQSRRALRLLASRGFDICIFHVLHPDEVHPPFGGRLRLRDAESGGRHEVWFEGEELETYLKIVGEFAKSGARSAGRTGCGSSRRRPIRRSRN